MASKELNPEESPQTYYGAELRRRREEAGLSQERLAAQVYCSAAYIGQMETAVRKPQLDLSRRMDGVLHTGGYLERLCAMVLKVMEHTPCSADPAVLEQRARTISVYAPSIVPALLQTPQYACAIKSANPDATHEEVESHITAMRERARLLDRGRAFWAVMHESVLRTPVGSTETMREQLAHILGLIRLRRIVVQIMPFAAGAHEGMGAPLSLMTFDDAPPVAHIEGPHARHLLDDPELVARCEHTYGLARADALSRETSMHLLATAADEYHGRCIRELA